MRILLVEDDHMLGAATREALRDATHAVDWVLDGASALTAAQGGEYELMLLDLGLPKRDG
ncbi:MAG: response regulator, partial [Thiomonas sp.]|nr:response regulator [Thiomonas sp.]